MPWNVRPMPSTARRCGLRWEISLSRGEDNALCIKVIPCPFEPTSSPARPAKLAEGDIETAFAGDQKLLNLRTAIANGANSIVAVIARHRAFLHIANPAVNLDGKIGAFRAGFGRMILRHRQLLEIVAALIDAPCRTIS